MTLVETKSKLESPPQATTLEEANEIIQQQQREIDRLGERLTLLLNRLYSRKAERIDPNQLLLFSQEQEDEPIEPSEDEDDEEAKKDKRRKKKKGHGREGFPKDLPRVEQRFDLNQDERACPCCSKEMKAIGEEVAERGHLIPARIVVNRIVRVKYACPDGHTVKTAVAPPALIDKCKYEPSVFAHVAVAKYADHLPLNRLSGIFKRYGIHLPKTTMWEMLRRVDELAAQPILRQMRKELLEERVLHADETPVQVRIEGERGTKQGWIWIYCRNNKILHEFTMTRGRDGPANFLKGWCGNTLISDGYSGYNKAIEDNNLTRAGCWSHARRKFKEALECGPKKQPARMLRYVQRLFRIESALMARRDRLELDEQTFHLLRHEVRQRRATPLLKEIERVRDEIWIEPSTLPRSELGKAVSYLRNQWTPLTRFLLDGEVDIHNNIAERGLRAVATGRKNWLVFGSPRGGEVASRLYSIILSCKAIEVNPEAYLEDVLQRVSTTPDAEIAKLTPWGWQAERDAANQAAAD